MRLIDETAYQNIIAKIPMGERSFVKAWETAQGMPTIYAVPVVCCKDCVKRNTPMYHAGQRTSRHGLLQPRNK